jgi:hypothetical protein
VYKNVNFVLILFDRSVLIFFVLLIIVFLCILLLLGGRIGCFMLLSTSNNFQLDCRLTQWSTLSAPISKKENQP